MVKHLPLTRPGPWEIGELTVTASGSAATVHGPGTRGSVRTDIRQIPWPGDELRETVRFDARGRYRPLSGAKSLPGGWLVRCNVNDAGDVVETVYPLALVHQRQWEGGELRIVPLDAVLSRQSGRYAVAATLDQEGRSTVREVLCGRCVRVPAWNGGQVPGGAIPCPEPCSVFVSLCREAALWQDEPPPGARPDPTAPFADFEREGNELREAYLAHRYGKDRAHDEQ